MPKNLAVVTAADADFFDLLQGMIRSLRDRPAGRDVRVYVFDLGLGEAQRRWLLVQGAALRRPGGLPGFEHLPIHLQTFLSRCRIPELLPGHDTYLWIDADAWVQRWEAIDQYVEGAQRYGFAVTPEADPAYDMKMFLGAHRRSFALFGQAGVECFSTAGSFNAGVFAGRADAPHWRAWRRLLESQIGKPQDQEMLFLFDQTALTLACTQPGLPTARLPATCNWLCHFALPMVSPDGGLLMRPLPPHEPLGIVHQAWRTKREFFALRRLGGGFLSRSVSYQAGSQLPRDDYVSPGLTVIMPDRCFPNLERSGEDNREATGPRRGALHARLRDRRLPGHDFLNRDEAHILYNLALGFCTRRGLTIGCQIGWSAGHLALAGLDLDVIDPLLADPAVAASVHGSLQAARVPGPVRLVPRRSPDAIHGLAEARAPWSFFLIGGDSAGEARLADVEACQRYAASDCAFVFTDLASPDAAPAVLYLKDRGWSVRVYHTAGIMAVAWHGDVRPVAHRPDPRIDWPIPDHLKPLLP